jgi:hypothetical protein
MSAAREASMPGSHTDAIERLACSIAAQTCDARLGIPYPREPDDDAQCLEWCNIDHQSADGITW